MYCSSCGSPHPEHAAGCRTSRLPVRGTGRGQESVAGRSVRGGLAQDGGDAVPVACGRCGYTGEGLPYFSRGANTAGLLAATFFTLPFALGAGGLLYYGLRRDHLICPRCGDHWGAFGARARVPSRRVLHADEQVQALSPGPETVRRTWAVLLFVIGGILLLVAAVQGEWLMALTGLLSVIGGVAMHRGARRARLARREALIALLQTQVIQLAGRRAGRLTVTDTAASLGWTLARAQKVLRSLDDGWRVDSLVTDEGVIVYEFRELLPAQPRADPLSS
jgi:ribosomal protein S27AE